VGDGVVNPRYRAVKRRRRRVCGAVASSWGGRL